MLFLFCSCRVPFLLVGILLVLGQRTDTIDSAFFYGRAQVRERTHFKWAVVEI